MVIFMDIFMLKNVDICDKIFLNLKEYYDYYGIWMKEEYEIKDSEKFNVFLVEF